MKTKKKKIITIIVFAVIVAAVVGVVVMKVNQKKQADTAMAVQTDKVIRGDLDETITGTAALEPYERYEIIAEVNGDIISAPYEKGDSVKKGDVLYQFDTSDTDTSIQKQQISLQQQRNSLSDTKDDLAKLTITAPCSGVISGLDLTKGKDVQNAQVLATIENTYELEVILPFNETQVSRISVGDAATVSSSTLMSSVPGTVSHISQTTKAQSDGSTAYDVTIKMTNPGSFVAGMVVGGEINGNISSGSGTIKSQATESVKAEIAGKVSAIHVSNGDYVYEGQTLVTLTSDSLSSSIRNGELQLKSAELSYQETMDSLDDYKAISPADGIVIEKNSKAGDTIDRTSSTQVLMVIGNISKLKFELSIDELDISKIEAGQEVRITCDAVEGKEYKGVITNVDIEGEPTNGVTVYGAEVVIDEPGELRPDMNIDATVVIASSKDTLMVPTADIQTVMGKSYVFRKSTGTDASEKKETTEEKKVPGNMPEGERMPPEGAEGMPMGEKPEMGAENAPAAGEGTDGEAKAPQGEMPEGAAGKGGRKAQAPQAPEGYETVEVTTGLSNDSYTEILSGLNEGDEIYRSTTVSSGNNSQMPGGMGGMQGGMGGMSGGMGGGPSGRMSGGGMGGGR